MITLIIIWNLFPSHLPLPKHYYLKYGSNNCVYYGMFKRTKMAYLYKRTERLESLIDIQTAFYIGPKPYETLI